MNPLPRLHVLSWERALLVEAVERLAVGWDGQAALDLSDLVVLVPTRQSGRRLREALAVHAAKRGQAVFPPQVWLPEQVIEAARSPDSRATAGRPAQLLAWITVLRRVPLSDWGEIFPVEPPQQTFAWALQMAEALVNLQETLAENALRLRDVVERAGPEFPERGRWLQLGQLETAWAAELAQRGLTSTADALQDGRAQPPPGEIRRIILLAVVDPRPSVLDVLKQWLHERRVEVWAWGDPAHPERFDAWGRPDGAWWSEAPVADALAEPQLHVRADLPDQARWTADWVARAYAAGAGGALGCADPELVPALAGAIEAAGRPVFLPQGVQMQQHAVYGLLEALLRAVREDLWEPLRALAQQEPIVAWLGRGRPTFSRARWLRELDELHAEHLPPNRAEAQRHAAADAPGLAEPLTQLGELLDRLRTSRFPEGWRNGLQLLFAGQSLDVAREEDAAFVEVADAWKALAETIGGWSGDELEPLDAMSLALRLLAAQRRFTDKAAEALELDGWLELPFRAEPHLVVVGLNEGMVPEAIVGHAFLPESLREQLGLRTNRQRLARDAWQLAALAASRRSAGRLDVVLGQSSRAGEPLRPSRLLLQCSDDRLAIRVRHLFRELPPRGALLPWTRGWQWRVPDRGPPERLRVTGFRDYLRCPFRFYLRHRLGLESAETDKRELDARDFGSLLHKVLEQLGRNPAWRDCTNDRDLAFGFAAELDRLVAERFGSELSLPLIVQIESARQRLAHAARVQAETRREGWRIEHVEWPFPDGQLTLGNLPIRGTIDRIERHQESGAWRVLDYKTAESAVSPLDAHWRRIRSDEVIEPDWPVRVEGVAPARRWVDLQLPLYRWAVEHSLGARDVALGYVNLPKALGETSISLWEPDPRELQESAMRCAHAVAEAVAAGRFWPPVEEVRNDDYAALFHEGTAASIHFGQEPVNTP